MTSLPPNRATTLKAAFRACDVGPLLGPDVERYYVDLSAVRNTEAIEGVSARLDFLEPAEFSSILFTGHRGCGKSTELRRIQQGIIKVNQGEFQDAIALFQQSLDLTQRIGDVQNQAVTLAMLGQLLADEKGEVETALNYLQQALDILQRLQSPEAETVSRILDRVKRDSYPVVGKNNERE